MKGWHIAVLLLLIIGAWYLGYINFNVPGSIQGPQPSAPANMVAVTKPIKFAVTDPLAGSAVASASIQIYGPDKVLRETLTTDSSGSATTSLPYRSGETYYVKVSKTGYVTRWFTVSVPYMSQADAQSLTTNFVALQLVQLGTYTIKIVDQFGNVYTSPATINFTTLGVTSLTLTINIYNTKDNSGFVSSTDPINGVSWGAVLLLSTAGTSVVVQNAGTSVVRGTTTYYILPVSDNMLTRQVISGQYVKPGVASLTITVSKGSLVKGQTQSFTLNLQAYFDPSYFAANGIGSLDAASLTTFTLNLAA